MSSTGDGVSFSRQVLRRKLNERLRNVTESRDDDTIDVFCECGRRTCSAQIRVGIGFYEGLVTSDRRYLVVQGHEDDASDVAVGIYERFLVVDRS